MSDQPVLTDVDVLLFGLHLLYRPRELDSAIAFDEADDVGGACYWSRYPGARCTCRAQRSASDVS